MYKENNQNNQQETPSSNQTGGVSKYEQNLYIPNKELDKQEKAQNEAQNELSQALHDSQTLVHRTHTTPSKPIEHTARIGITPIENKVSSPTHSSPFILDTMTQNSNQGETIQGASHSMNISAKQETSPLHDKNLSTIPEYEKPQTAEQKTYTPNPQLRTLRTFKSDLAQAVKNSGESITSIALAAHKRKEEVPTPKQNSYQTNATHIPVISATKNKATVNSYKPHAIHHLEQQPPQIKPSITYTTNTSRPQSISAPTRIHTQPEHPINTGSMRVSTQTTYKQQIESMPVKNVVAVPFFKNIFFLLISITLLGMGGFGLYSVFIAHKVQNTEINITQPTAMVHYDTFSEVSLTNRDVFISAIKNGTNILPVSVQSVWYAYIPNVSVESLLLTIAPRIPDVFTRNTKAPFAIGYYKNQNGEPRFYMTLTFSDFGQAFSGALKWEDTLYQDMQGLFIQELDNSLYGYIDAIIGNKDIRKLVNTNGKSFIVYGFIDQNTFVLAEDEVTFAAISNNIFAHRSTR